MEVDRTSAGATEPLGQHVESVVTRVTTTTAHARPSQPRPAEHERETALDDAASPGAPGDFALLHFAPATTTTVVTTTTQTTTHFAPIRIPKSRPIRAVHSSFSGPSGDAAMRHGSPVTPRTSIRQLIDESSEAGPSSSALPLDPKMYPLSSEPWPGSMRQFQLALGDMSATYVEDPAEAPTHAGAGVGWHASGGPPRSAKGKGKARIEDESDISPLTGGAEGLSRNERGALHQRRLSRRPRGAGHGQDALDEEADRVDDVALPLRHPSPGPPRKRARADSTSQASVVGDASVAATGRRLSQAHLQAHTTSMGPPATVVSAAALPSPNQSPPSPVPTFGGEDSQELRDDDVDVAAQADAVGLRQSFDFGSGIGLSGLLSLPDLVKSFDQLQPTLQSYLLFQLLRRSSIPVLQSVNQVVEHALRRDFLSDLPLELGTSILSYFDVRDLCRASLVSKTWRRLIDGEWRVWKDKLVAEGFWIGDGSDEREARDISRGGKEDLFLKRWKAGVWDKKKRSKWSGRVHVDDLYGGGPTPQGSSAVNHRLASPSSSREASPIPPSHFVHPFKLLYRHRVLIRRNWQQNTPKRLNFPYSSSPQAGNAGNAAANTNNHVVTCLQFDKDKIVSSSDDHSISVFETQTGALKAVLSGHEGGVWALQYVGNVLVSGSTDRTVRVWDLDTYRCTHVFIGHTSTVRCLQIVEPQNVNPDPSGPPIWEPPHPIIVTGSRDHTLRVWKLPMPGKDADYEPPYPESPSEEAAQPAENPFHLRHLRGHTQAVRALAAHGKTLVSGSYDMDVRVWDTMTGECRHVLQGHTQKVYSVVYDPTRKQVASGSMDGTVRLWSTETGELRGVLEGHASLVGLLGLTHRNLVSAAADWTLRIWDPDTGACRHSLAAHQGAITCFQHDEDKVISGSDGTLKMWDVRTGAFVRDLLTNLTGVWQVSFDQRFCVAAVSRNGRSEFEVLDFGSVEPERPSRAKRPSRTPRIKTEDSDAELPGAFTDGGRDVAMSDAAGGEEPVTPGAGTSNAAPPAPRLRAGDFSRLPSGSSSAASSLLAQDSTPSREAGSDGSSRRTVRRLHGSRDLQAQASTSTQAMDVERDGSEDEAANSDDEVMSALVKSEEEDDDLLDASR
ncbi:SCF ubiquitin ligase complex subunit cdc4 [Rhodotorula toruloides]